jgi:HEAT repeat protein/transcriptional regulator with XRE-family HTH domain
MNRDGRRGGFLANEEGVKKLKEAKRSKKYTYQKIADEAHVTLDQIKRLFNPQWGNGQYKIGEEALEAIAKVLDLDPADIVDRYEYNHPVEENQHDAVCHFLAEIENSFKYLRLLHIREQRIVLQDQYIPIQVTLERKYKHEVETILSYAESEAELKRAYSLKHQEESQPTQVDWAEAKKQHQRIMVLADPGMGKSTLLTMEAGLTAQKELKSLKGNSKKIEDVILPLFLRLSELVDEKQADIFSKEMIDAIPLILGKEYPKTLQDNRETSAVIQHILNEKLKTGKCLLLLDALDEVPQKYRLYLSEKLNRFVRNYPCSIICTSRIAGYRGTFLDGAKDVEIIPFSQKQTEKYIEIWFKNATGYLNDNSVSAPALIRELQNKPQIRGLAQNPLLLWLICSLYQEKGLTLPARRCEVYEEAVSYMLEKWSLNRQPQSEGRIIAKTLFLAELAYHFTCEGQEIFSKDELYDRIEDFLQGQRVPTDFKNATTGELIAELSEQDGILQKLHEQGDQYLFLHRTFQEYLTACYLNRAKDGIAVAKAHFWEYEWHETLSLMAGWMKNPVPLLEAITAEKDDIFSTKLLLAGRCIAESKNISHPLIGEIIERIYEFWCRHWKTGFMEPTLVALAQVYPQLMEKIQITLLNRENDLIFRQKAAFVLGATGKPQAVKMLVSALKDENRDIKFQAVLALGLVGNSEAVRMLISLLKDKNEDRNIRWQVVGALGLVGNIPAILALEDALKDEDLLVKQGAAEILGRMGNEQAIPALISLLESGNPDVRWGVVCALKQVGSSQAVQVLIFALKDKDLSVRIAAANALYIIGNPEAEEALISALDDESINVKVEAALALDRMGSPKGIEALIPALDDKEINVRIKAIEALGQMINLQEIIAFTSKFDNAITTLNSEYDRIEHSQVNPDSISNIEKGIADLKIFPIVKIKIQLFQLLRYQLYSEEWFIRWIIASALGRMGDYQIVEEFIYALSHSNEYMRNEYIFLSNLASRVLRTQTKESLSYIKPQAVQELIYILKDHKDVFVKQGVLWTFFQMRDTQTIPALISVLNDEHGLVTRSALEALAQIGTSDILEKLIENPEIDIYRPDIFLLARKLTVRYMNEGLPFIPVYPELVNREANTGA